MGDESAGDIVLRKQREPTSFPCRRQPGGRGKPAGRSLMRRRLRHERHPLGTAGRGGRGGGDSGLIARKPGIVRPRTTGRGDGPPEVGCVARRDSRAGKGGNVSWVASPPLHSDGRADGRRSCEIAPCLQNGRMGSEYAGTDRDSRPCTGAKDLWGAAAHPVERIPPDCPWGWALEPGWIRQPGRRAAVGEPSACRCRLGASFTGPTLRLPLNG